MNKLFLIIIIVAFCAVGFSQQTDNWKELYQQDLEDICSLIKEHHPGCIDTLNPAFSATMAISLEQATSDKQYVDDYTSYLLYLKRFVNAFQDRHLLLFHKKTHSPSMLSAGIYPKYVNGKFIVDSVNTALYPELQITGATISEVDNTPVDSFFIKQHLEFDGNKAILADWYYNAPRLLTSYKVKAIPLPQRISVIHESTKQSINLKWTESCKKEIRAIQNKFSSSNQDKQFTIQHMANKSVWISIPTFHLNNEQKDAYTALKDSLNALRDLDLLVIDLRGNSGGNSFYGDELAKAIYGEEFVTQTKALNTREKYYEYRTSEQNAATLSEYNHEFFKKIADSMNQARLKGLQLYRYDINPQVHLQEQTNASNQCIAKKVVVITDVMCFSACLSFMDIIRADANTIHVGLPTGADSQYIENRGEWLSSGFTGLSFSMLVARNSIREPNQAYHPSVPYPYEMSNTNRLQKWVLDNF